MLARIIDGCRRLDVAWKSNVNLPLDYIICHVVSFEHVAVVIAVVFQ